MSNSHGNELWEMHTGLRPDGLDQLISLVGIPRKMQEIEKKYFFPSVSQGVDMQVSNIFSKVGDFVNEKSLQVVSLTTFVGIDQYFIFTSKGKEFHFRYRSGANRPPQLTIKYQLQKRSNIVRGEINLAVDRADPSRVRAFMSVIAEMIGRPIIFAIQQSGNIWVVSDPRTSKEVEIVVYRVKRFVPSVLEGVFVEIEPLESHEADEAFAAIKSFEKALKLKEFFCPQSIGEMFRPGNERLVTK